MTFLQPWILLALPLLGLPVAIHLIHRRRHRMVAWGAMMFLLQGVRMSRGMQRLRHILLMTLRTAAVLALVLGLARPLAGGWLGGLGGGRPDTVLILVDRSASMSALSGTGTKLAAGVERMATALEEVQAARFAVIDSVGLQVSELRSPSDLVDLPIVGPTAAQSDLAAMFEVAAEHLRASASGRAEIWVLSDGQSGDWQAEDSRWGGLAEALTTLPAGLRVNVLQFAERAPDNLSIRVERAEPVDAGGRGFVSLDLRIRASQPVEVARSVSVAVDLGGARSVVQVELRGAEGELVGHRLPIESDGGPGWGWVELPGDANAADNRFYFTYGAGGVQEAVVVAEDPAVEQVLAFACEAPVSDAVEYTARRVSPADVAGLDLSASAVLFWQAPLPQGPAAQAVEEFLAAGGQVVFLPPASPGGEAFHGCTWAPERELGSAGAPAAPSTWRRESDLLRDGDDGTVLPVGALGVRRLRPVLGDVTPLASFEDGTHLLTRAPTERGGLYFLGTTPSAAASDLANQGVVLVALVHRMHAAAAAAIGSRGQATAGAWRPAVGEPTWVSAADEAWLLAERLHQAGVARSGEEFVALNRGLAEDVSGPLSAERLLGLLPGVEVSLVLGGGESVELVDEIWRAFLLLLLVALLGEALLCLTESRPRPRPEWAEAGA